MFCCAMNEIGTAVASYSYSLLLLRPFGVSTVTDTAPLPAGVTSEILNGVTSTKSTDVSSLPPQWTFTALGGKKP